MQTTNQQVNTGNGDETMMQRKSWEHKLSDATGPAIIAAIIALVVYAAVTDDGYRTYTCADYAYSNICDPPVTR